MPKRVTGVPLLGGATHSGTRALAEAMGLQRRLEGTVDAIVFERVLNPKFFTHLERFDQLPVLNASIAPASADDGVDGATAAELALMIRANRNIELVGEAADNAGVTYADGGGILMETFGGAGDAHALQSHRDTDLSSLLNVEWDTRNRPLILANIVTGPDAADIADTIIGVGYKLLYDDDWVVATDADQAFFRYENGVNGGRWEAVTSVASSAVSADTGIAVAANTLYRLLIDVDRNRVPRYYINDELVATGAALTALDTLDWYLGITDGGGGAARQMTIRNFMVSQLYG